MQLKRIAIDTSKHVFTLHGVDEHDQPVLRRDLKRASLLAFMAKCAPTDVVLEACGASHHWARQLQQLGHRVRLIPPQYVKPFVKRGKSDRIDAAAISDAASRPDMHFVPVKTADTQADLMVLRSRDLLVRQRTQLCNAVRGHAAEFGIIAARGTRNVAPLLAKVAEQADIPQTARDMIALLGSQIAQITGQIDALDAQLKQMHTSNPLSRALAEVPGIGPVAAINLVLRADPAQFSSARHFAAWIGLTPRQNSTGGRPRLGGISRKGNEGLRQVLVVGAMALVRAAVRKPDSRAVSPWLRQLLARKPRKLAAVAAANKIARIAWAMMSSGEAYRGGSAPATA